MKKVLYISDNKIYKKDLIGVKKKILNQIKYFNDLGFIVTSYLDSNNEMLTLNNKSYKASKIFKHLYFFNFLNNIIDKDELKFDIIYIRNVVNINLLSQIIFFHKNKNSKIILEIPTYPYFYHYKGILKKILYGVDRLKYFFLKNLIDVILYSGENVFEIFGIKNVLKINHYVNLDSLPLKKESINQSTINFISVSSLNEYHGIDRIINGVINYKKKHKNIDFKVLIVGDNFAAFDKYKSLVYNNKLDNHIKMLGFKTGDDLNNLYDSAHIAISTLGLYKLNLNTISSMKSAEYAARGIPFIIGYYDNDFDDSNFTFKVSNDEAPLDFQEILNWYSDFNDYSARSIRDYILKKPNWELTISKLLKK